ncbi:GntR family transcriptional regulator [Paeniglutamicibacter sp. Y32M11]|uniref:GntR family transcriptional regulator n=1 Tax=Paeniglutamicibacter sp. Y32M11 TaxID=2853258 RepID=UPI00104EABD1|nr:GntR family transcriptional regulator [Paeniglutamicibacter sp. Y32M11]QXQ11709.1 GntR family transcriptional regulator [Paeniglutamicibacter sp. Y32M11]
MDGNPLAFIALDPTDKTAPYQQVRQQILAAISKGKLKAGTKLPSVRALAEQLGLAVNTAAKVYKELEGSGAVVTRGRHGTIVQATEDEGSIAVADAASELAAIATRWGISEKAAVAYVRAAFTSQLG